VNPRDPNVALLETVARALGPLNDRVVFVGGCAVGLLITDEARPIVRATQDVDLIAEVASYAAYHGFTTQLRRLGFVEDGGEVLCRWRLGKLQVDVMAPKKEVLGSSNRWFPQAIRDAQNVRLPSGQPIRLISPPLLLATKLDAFYDRGRGDYGASHDIEDIVNLIDGRPQLVEETRAADVELREYLQEEFDGLLGESGFTDSIAWHLAPSDVEQERATIVIQRLRAIGGV
jgi:predicted nucleotidyltransferase